MHTQFSGKKGRSAKNQLDVYSSETVHVTFSIPSIRV